MRKHIPNFITMINLFFGCCALVCVFNDMFIWVFYFLFLAGVADYADGMAARLLKVKSPVGKELDSLADMVSFGVVPGAIIYMLLTKSPIGIESDFPLKWWALAGFIITVFSCWRLAKFNLDVRQSDDFIGLNTPSCTMFITGLMLIYELDSAGLGNFVVQPFFLYSVVTLCSFLLVAEIPMFSLKFKGMQWQGNEDRIVFMLVSFLLMFFLKEIAFSLIIILYVLYSLTRNLVFKNS